MARKHETVQQPTIDADELIDAMQTSDDLVAHLDLETGAVEILPVGDDLWSPELVSIDGEPERFVEIERIETGEQYRWMREFAANLGDDAPDVAELLAVALEGRGAFGRFRAALGRHRDIEARWYVWQAERGLEHAKDWLRRTGIRMQLSTPRALAGPAREATPPTSSAPEIGLLHVLLLGAPEGKTELIDGRVHRFVTAPNAKQADQLLRRLVRQACIVQGFDYRRSLVDNHDFVTIGELTFARRGTTIDVAVAVSAAMWRAFS